METLILFLLIYIAEALIFYWYCTQRFICVFPKKTVFFIFFTAYGALLGFSQLDSFIVNTILFTLANLIIIKLAFKASFGNALFHSLITTCLMSFSEIAIMGLSKQFNKTILYSLSNIVYLSVLTILSKLLYFLFLNIIARLLPFSRKELTNSNLQSVSSSQRNFYSKENTLLNIVPLISIYIIIVLLSVLLNTDINVKLRYMLSSCAFLLIFINVLTFYIYHYTIEKNSELTELKIQQQKEHDMVEYYKALFSQNENQRIMIHDIRNHLMSISRLNDQNDTQKITDYLKALLNSSELKQSVHISDNEMLNSIMCHYIQLCEGKHIGFKSDIRKHSLTFIDYADLTTIFCNLLDNAIEACTNVPNSFIELSITPKDNTSFTVINIINTCRNNPSFNKNGNPITIKQDKAYHGLGIKSIERIANKYGGNIKMYYDKEKHLFHSIIVVKNK